MTSRKVLVVAKILSFYVMQCTCRIYIVLDLHVVAAPIDLDLDLDQKMGG